MNAEREKGDWRGEGGERRGEEELTLVIAMVHIR